MSIVIAILILGFIVLIHEGGHFLVAKMFKVPVREFSIGMGPRVFSKVINNTRYSLKAFPFGGSCAMIGEDIAGSGDFSFDGGELKDDGTIDFDGVVFTKEEIEKNNFSNISPLKKFLICLAGPFSNFLLAFIFAIFLVASVGFDIPTISEVPNDGAAAMASPYKIEAGDTVVGIEIPGEKDKINCYRDLTLFMQLNNDDIIKFNYPIILYLDRNGEEIKTALYPKVAEENNKAMIGIAFQGVYKKATSFTELMKQAFGEFYFYINTTVKSLRMLIRGKLTAKEISGPVGTVAVMGDVINEAKSINIMSVLYTVFMFIVLISANLGVMNLLPIPALDGGRIVFAAIEMIMGKKMNREIETVANTVTMLLLLIFMMWVFGMDIYKLMIGK